VARKVRDIMTGSLVSVSPDSTLVAVARRMRDEDVGDVLVVDGDRLQGLATDRDLVDRGLAADADPTKAEIGGIVSEPAAVVNPDDDLTHAVKLMREHSVRRLPVVLDGRPVGILSLGDLAIEKDERSALADISAAEPDR
jgi:CBS domain-containing protein